MGPDTTEPDPTRPANPLVNLFPPHRLAVVAILGVRAMDDLVVRAYKTQAGDPFVLVALRLAPRPALSCTAPPKSSKPGAAESRQPSRPRFAICLVSRSNPTSPRAWQGRAARPPLALDASAPPEHH
jgi:hypothetical protein